MTVRIPYEASESSDLMRCIHAWQRLHEAAIVGAIIDRRASVPGEETR
jgi:hypothetical protein